MRWPAGHLEANAASIALSGGGPGVGEKAAATLEGVQQRLSRWVLVVAAALVASVAATAVAGAASTPAVAVDRYVALGDSFSSGVGTGSYTLSSSCRRSVHAYPYLVAQQRPNTSLAFVACSGATTSDVLAKQVQAVDASTTIATITVGGNDIGFADLIYRCTLGACASALDSTRNSLERVLGPRLDTVYATVKSRAAFGAKLIVLGYPRIFGTGGCLGTFGITATERVKANQLATALDRTLATHATAAGLTYRSFTGSFATHPVCSTSAWLNGLNPFDITESYHPNRSGNALGYLPAVRAITG